MSKLSALFVLSCLLALAVALPEPRLQQRQLQQQQQRLQHPYLFFSTPRGRSNLVQGFEVVEEPDDDEDDLPLRRLQHSDDDDDDDDDELANDDDDDEDLDAFLEQPAQRGLNFGRSGQLVLLNSDADADADVDAGVEQEQQDDDEEDAAQVPVVLARPGVGRKAPAVNGQQLLKNARPTQMMVARDQAGAIMVPDGIIEIEGQSVVDEKTGKAALLVPRAALDAIPDGAVVALMERSAGDNSVGEERANRVIVRRRKTGVRRNVQRRRRGGRPVRRRNNVRRRNSNRRRNVRVIRPNTGNRRRGGAQRRPGQIVMRG